MKTQTFNMKKNNLPILTVISFLLIVLILVLILINLSNQGKEKKDFTNNNVIRAQKQMEKGDAIVANIWITKESLSKIKENKIKYLIIDIGDTSKSGKIETPKNEINDFLSLITDYEKENNYNFIILSYSEINTYSYDFNDKLKNNFISDYSMLIESGFDGVYVDIEPVRFSEREEYLDFLNFLNLKIPKNKIIAVYSGTLSKGENDNEWGWDRGYFKKVSDKVDLIFIPGYDYSISEEDEYKEELKYQVSELSKLNLNSNLMLGIPTHKNYPETIENSLSVYASEVQKNNGRFVGIGIFAEWTMDENEWEVYERFKNPFLLGKL